MAGEQVPTEVNGYGRNETPAQRADRNFGELLQELRVAQTGVQILFAFLLTIPFQARFPMLDLFQRGTYVVTLLLCAAATALLIAPVPYHRVLFGRGRKAAVVKASNRLAGAGLAVMLLAIAGGVMLIMDVLLGRVVGVAMGLAVAIGFGLLWYVLPRRLARRSDD